MKGNIVQDHMISLESLLPDECDNFRLVSMRMSREQAEQLREQVAQKYGYLKTEIAQETETLFSVIVSETVTQTQQEVIQ